MSSTIKLIPLNKLALIEPGDDIAQSIIDGGGKSGITLANGDILVIAQKIISKSENRYRYLNQIEPSERALELSPLVDKDPQLVQCILDESQDVLKYRPGVIIVRHRNGYVHANAGIDQSNIEQDDQNPRVLLLPEDPDKSAVNLREAFHDRLGLDIKIVINDSAGRPWRNGIAGFAIGSAGFNPINDRIGAEDLFGRALEVTQIAVADELAAAGSLLMGQGNEGVPVVIVRGFDLDSANVGSSALIRDPAMDLFQ